MKAKFFTKKRLLIGGLLILFLFLLTMCGGGSDTNKINMLETVKKRDIVSEVITSGQLKPFKQTTVGAQVTGEIKKLYIAIGERVSQGELIAELDPTVQKNNLAKAKDNLTAAETELSTWQRKLTIAKSDAANYAVLYKNGATSKSEYDKYVTLFKETSNTVIQAKAKINQARLDVENMTKDVSYTKIVSPMTGVVVSLPVEVGQTLTAGFSTPTVAVIADIDRMQIKAQISEADIYHVAPGQKATFTILGNPNKKFHAAVDVVHPAPTYISDNSTGTSTTYYYTTLNVTEKDTSFRVDMTVNVSIVTAAKNNVPAISNTAIFEKGHKTYVKVVNAKGKINEVPVTTGVSNGILTEIKSGLKSGDKVISQSLGKES